MDKIRKTLLKLPDKERKKLMAAFGKVLLGSVQGLDIKKLKGHKDLYRLRVGDNRLVYQHKNGERPEVIFIGRRNDQTYRDF